MSNENKLGLEPAYPLPYNVEYVGISKRLLLARTAMQGLLSNPALFQSTFIKQQIVEDAFEMADLMLKQESL